MRNRYFSCFVSLSLILGIWILLLLPCHDSTATPIDAHTVGLYPPKRVTNFSCLLRRVEGMGGGGNEKVADNDDTETKKDWTCDILRDDRHNRLFDNYNIVFVTVVAVQRKGRKEIDRLEELVLSKIEDNNSMNRRDSSGGRIHHSPTALGLTVSEAIIEGIEMKIPSHAVLTLHEIGTNPKQNNHKNNGDSSRNNNRNSSSLDTAIGTRTVLGVRVHTIDSSPTVSQKEVETVLFGDEDDTTDLISMKSQYEACSYGKLRMIKAPSGVPSTGGLQQPLLTQGFFDLYLNIKASSNTIYGLMNVVQNDMEYLFGQCDRCSRCDADCYVEGTDNTTRIWENWYKTNLGDFDHVVFVMPISGDWAPRASLSGSMTWFHNTDVKRHDVVMHEIGHNLGLYHTGDLNYNCGDKNFCDKTGYMGKRDFKIFNPVQKCFNAFNSYQLGWYGNRVQTINPFQQLFTDDNDDTSIKPPLTYKLMGVASHKSRNKKPLVVLELETESDNNFYIGYNRHKKFNRGCQDIFVEDVGWWRCSGYGDDPNSVILIEEDSSYKPLANPNAAGSWKRHVFVNVGDSYDITNYGGVDGKTVRITLVGFAKKKNRANIELSDPTKTTNATYVTNGWFRTAKGKVKECDWVADSSSSDSSTVAIKRCQKSLWSAETAEGELISSSSFETVYDACPNICGQYKQSSSYSNVE